MTTFLYNRLDEPEDRIEHYHSVLQKHSDAIESGVAVICRVLQHMFGHKPDNVLKYRGVCVLLARHVAEELDAASVLVGKGCTSPCRSHLRSAFEAELSLRYILETDVERRAIAYIIKHAKDRIRGINRIDRNSDYGVQARKQMDEISLEVLNSIPTFDYESSRNRIEQVLNREDYVEVHTEWKRTKAQSKRKPNWYALFDGPKSIRDLALHMDRGYWYDFLYSDWSNHLHAGSGMLNVAKDRSDESGDSSTFRPIRLPEELQLVLTYSNLIANQCSSILAKQFLSPIGQQDVRDQYLNEVKPKVDELQKTRLGIAWR